ncbi:UDP-glucose 4-epimerase [Anaerolineaceae bacterium]|nr:UDP-glucose 4-epimerase [Anaerolineaceae bacterium]
MTGQILVTGGAGYIGSHMVRILAQNGHNPVVFDNLSTGHREFVPATVPFIEGDLRSTSDIGAVFRNHKITGVIHFAAALVVPESVANPHKYYDNNFYGSLTLLTKMFEYGVYKLVFSSTATVYGNASTISVTEDTPTVPISPYGNTKLFVEHMISDLSRATELRYATLRYFNVAGCHLEWGIGTKTRDTSFLIPSVMQVACGEKQMVTVFGDDYDTPDGTCIRDYISVVDLCEAHLLAYKALDGNGQNQVFNIGTGHGLSVMEIIRHAEKVTGKSIRYEFARRRPGDVEQIYANPEKAKQLLGWASHTSTTEMLRSAWEWQKKLSGQSTDFR